MAGENEGQVVGQEAINTAMTEIADETAQAGEDTSEQETEETTQAEEVESTEEPTDEQPQQEEQEKPQSRAQKRIQQLASERSELAQQLAQQQQVFAQQAQQMQAQMQQAYQAQLQEASKQREILQRQLDLVQQRYERADESPYDKFRRENEEAAVKKARESFSPELDALKKQLNEEKQFREQAIQMQQQEAMYQEFKQKASVARQAIVTKDIASDKSEEISKGFDDIIMGYVASTNMEPTVAAQRLKGFLDKYYQARLSANAKGQGAKVKAAQQIPAVPNQAKQTTKNEYYPTKEELIKAGYDGLWVQWRTAGAPILQKK